MSAFRQAGWLAYIEHDCKDLDKLDDNESNCRGRL